MLLLLAAIAVPLPAGPREITEARVRRRLSPRRALRPRPSPWRNTSLADRAVLSRAIILQGEAEPRALGAATLVPKVGEVSSSVVRADVASTTCFTATLYDKTVTLLPIDRLPATHPAIAKGRVVPQD